jgi:hypothetical protein
MIEQFGECGITNWCGKHEIGETTKKPHYQMAVWCEHVKTEKEKDFIRKRFKRSKLTYVTKGAPCAIKSGRKIQSLASYCLKDDGATITNLNVKLVKKIPQWVNKTAEKAMFNDKLALFITKIEDTNVLPTIHKIIDFHVENFKLPPGRARMLYLLLKHKLIDTEAYRKETYNFNMFKYGGDEYSYQEQNSGDDYDVTNYDPSSANSIFQKTT